MSTAETIILLVIALIILITGLVFLSRASTSLRSIDFSKDPNLVRAERDILGGVITGWIVTILIIGGSIFFSEELFLSPFGLTIILVLVLILVITVGILSSLAASSIRQSNLSNTDPNVINAKDDAIIAASITLGSIILVIVCYAFYTFGGGGGVSPIPPYIPPIEGGGEL